MKRNMRLGGNPGNVVLPLLVAILAVTVGVQSYLLYRAYHQRPFGERTIRVEQPAAVQRQTPSQQRPDSRPFVPDPFAVLDEAWDGGMAEWDPFAEMERIRQQMERLFESSMHRFRRSSRTHGDWATAFLPEMDLSDDGNEYVLRFDLPGIDKSKVSVKLEDRVLTVQGGTSEAREEKQGGQIIRMERRSGSFARSVTLPGPVRSEGMKAEYENGVLTVRVPKADRASEQKVITL
jgi:HSP20 family protein